MDGVLLWLAPPRSTGSLASRRALPQPHWELRKHPDGVFACELRQSPVLTKNRVFTSSSDSDQDIVVINYEACYYNKLTSCHSREEGVVRLTSEMLGRYVGGQIDFLDPTGGTHYSGEIAQIYVDSSDSLVVWFAWMAEEEGYPLVPGNWVKRDTENEEVELTSFTVAIIGHGSIELTSPARGEIITIHPRALKWLDPAKVAGLAIATG